MGRGRAQNVKSVQEEEETGCVQLAMPCTGAWPKVYACVCQVHGIVWKYEECVVAECLLPLPSRQDLKGIVQIYVFQKVCHEFDPRNMSGRDGDWYLPSLVREHSENASFLVSHLQGSGVHRDGEKAPVPALRQEEGREWYWWAGPCVESPVLIRI